MISIELIVCSPAANPKYVFILIHTSQNRNRNALKSKDFNLKNIEKLRMLYQIKVDYQNKSNIIIFMPLFFNGSPASSHYIPFQCSISVNFLVSDKILLIFCHRVLYLLHNYSRFY